MEPIKKASVLIVDDEFLIQELWTIVVEDMGLDVCGRAATADDAIELARRHRPSVVLMDMRLDGEKDGVDAAVAIQSAMASKVIFVTGSHEEKTILRIKTSRPAAILFKPVSDRQIRQVIEAALRE
jgi:DNA-binding NarL/FixJ family response regulator